MKAILSQLSLITLLSLTIIMPIVASKTIYTTPAYVRRLQKPHGKRYTFNTTLISMSQKIRSLGLLIFYRATHKKKNLDQPITLIHDQLKEFETWLLREEHNAMIAIKNKFNLNNELWNNCLSDIDELKNIYRTATQQAHPNITHDANVPMNITNTFKTLLADNAINPDSISIKVVDNPNKKILMNISTIIETMVDPTNNRLIISKYYIPISIVISPAMIKQTNEQTILTSCAHEIEHILQHHCLTDSILKKYIKHYCSIDDETITSCPEFQKFCHIQEAQADLLSAIKNAEVAYALNNFRKQTYYPNYLYEEHYYNASTINMLWKLDSWLTWFYRKPSLKQFFASNQLIC